MTNKLHECVTELRKNHTNREIGGALSEYFQIVKGVAAEYTDDVAVGDLRHDHSELSFMDNDELEDILKHAKAWRHKSDGREPAQPDETDERLKRMEELHRKRMRESWKRERALIAYADTVSENRHEEAEILLDALDDLVVEALHNEAGKQM